MIYKEIHSNVIINKIIQKDNIFNGNYTLDPYQNCEFGCNYCDSSHDSTIYIKTNTIKIINKELKKIPYGRIIIGSVHDPYQKAEEKYKLTRDILKTINKHKFSCHILTKSELVLRDVDILKSMDSIVTISIISLDNTKTRNFEKNVQDTFKRLEIVRELNENKIKAGIAIIPILPFIIDDEIEELIKISKKYNAQYILYKHLELKGDQKKIFFEIIKNNYSNLLNDYINLYENSYFPNKKYIKDLSNKIKSYSAKYKTKNNLN